MIIWKSRKKQNRLPQDQPEETQPAIELGEESRGGTVTLPFVESPQEPVFQTPIVGEPIRRTAPPPYLVKGISRAERNVSFARQPGTAVTVATSATLILDLNTERMWALLVNDSTNKIYIALSKQRAVSGATIPLLASGGWISLGPMTDFPWTGEVWGIAGAASTLTVWEI